ncbi:hypothetical protein, partial [Paenibacillus sp. oral taxon 786]|uniref:hypothetical protein n=1 Tax=Paenibacillus sp. oral taxon 786 TaxID=652715 RepID=UPI001E54C5B8
WAVPPLLREHPHTPAALRKLIKELGPAQNGPKRPYLPITRIFPVVTDSMDFIQPHGAHIAAIYAK